jgi:branched-chain amino acid transport system permease protein
VIYREAGQFKTSYTADQAIFPIVQDKWVVLAGVLTAYLVPAAFANEYWLQAVLIPLVVYGLAALGLNLLVGYAGLLSLGTGGFMAVGAYSAFKLATAFPDVNILLVFLFGGLCAAAVGVVFGLPSLRIKGFYLAVATLAAQFFLIWLFNRVGWFSNNNPSGTIFAPPREVLGFQVTGTGSSPLARYLLGLTILVFFAFVAKHLVRGRIGRSWMAIRDMDIAAELIGIRPLRTKLLAFAVSSFYVGVAGVGLLFLYLQAAETLAFDINISFLVLFMVIIGGLGSILGSFLGAAFILLVPIGLTNLPNLIGINIDIATQKHIELMTFGGLIVFFLIVEPHGFARLWQIGKEKLRLWPFPH